MAFDLIALGTVPSGETPAAASEVDYWGRAFWQCRRFIDLLRHTVGAEPEGAKLRVRRSGPISIPTSRSSSSLTMRTMPRAPTRVAVTVRHRRGGTGRPR